MAQEELKQQALKIMEDSMIGTLATIKENKPHSRYMTFFNDEFTLYTATSKQTQKVDELESQAQTAADELAAVRRELEDLNGQCGRLRRAVAVVDAQDRATEAG